MPTYYPKHSYICHDPVRSDFSWSWHHATFVKKECASHSFVPFLSVKTTNFNSAVKLRPYICQDQSESGISIVFPDTEVGFKEQSGYGKSYSFGRDTAKMIWDATERLIEIDGDWVIEEKPALTIPSVILKENEASKDQLDSGVDTNVGFKGHLDNGKDASPVTPQQVLTGRKGEFVAFRYFSAKLGEKSVKWVNEDKESGLPYDIVIEDKDNSNEYIEVKSTSKAKKAWFGISTREWQFAVEKGDSFSIACVDLSAEKSAKITVYEDPYRKCQQGDLQLGFRSSKW